MDGRSPSPKLGDLQGRCGVVKRTLDDAVNSAVSSTVSVLTTEAPSSLGVASSNPNPIEHDATATSSSTSTSTEGRPPTPVRRLLIPPSPSPSHNTGGLQAATHPRSPSREREREEPMAEASQLMSSDDEREEPMEVNDRASRWARLFGAAVKKRKVRASQRKGAPSSLPLLVRAVA